MPGGDNAQSFFLSPKFINGVVLRKQVALMNFFTDQVQPSSCPRM